MSACDLKEALRYMGVRGDPSPEMLALAQEAAGLLTSEAHYRVLSLRLPVSAHGGLDLPGEAIQCRLAGCREALLLGCTLGSGVDRLIRQTMLTRPALALAVNGCAAALLESCLDKTCQELTCQLREEGAGLTARFSPGYGDLPLSVQPALLERLQAYRIGLTVNTGGQLQPEKSVTAICGITTSTAPGTPSGCSSCGQQNCAFRRAGT